MSNVRMIGCLHLGHEWMAKHRGFNDSFHHDDYLIKEWNKVVHKKDLTFNILGPLGDIVGEWIIKGAVIQNQNFGDFDWDSEGAANEITLTVQPDYCILNF